MVVNYLQLGTAGEGRPLEFYINFCLESQNTQLKMKSYRIDNTDGKRKKPNFIGK